METIWEGKAKGRKNETTDINAPPTCIYRSNFLDQQLWFTPNFYQDEACLRKPQDRELLEKREAKIRYGTSDFALQELGGVDLEPPRNSLCASFLYFPSLSSHKFNGKTSEK